VQQQPLLCADGCKRAQEPAAAAQASLQQAGNGCECAAAKVLFTGASSCWSPYLVQLQVVLRRHQQLPSHTPPHQRLEGLLFCICEAGWGEGGCL
jgi:hypothetical protein